MNNTQTEIDSVNVNAFEVDSAGINFTTPTLNMQETHCAILQCEDVALKGATNWDIALISLIVSILIFIIGFVINEAIRRWNKATELRQDKKFIEEWTEKSNSTLTTYIESLEEFSKKIKESTDLNIAQWKTGIIHLTRINSIPLEKYSDIYIYGLNERGLLDDENRKKLMNFLYQLEYVEKCPSLAMSVYDNYCKQNEKVMDEWNFYYLQLVDLFQMYHKIERTTDDTVVFHEIMNLFIPLLEKSSEEIVATDEWSREFIKPSMEKLSKIKNTTSPLFLQIIKLVKGLDISLKKHDKLKAFYQVFDIYIENLKEAQKNINESMEYFRALEIKRYCK